MYLDLDDLLIRINYYYCLEGNNNQNNQRTVEQIYDHNSLGNNIIIINQHYQHENYSISVMALIKSQIPFIKSH